jgi:hypothetical protein
MIIAGMTASRSDIIGLAAFPYSILQLLPAGG